MSIKVYDGHRASAPEQFFQKFVAAATPVVQAAFDQKLRNFLKTEIFQVQENVDKVKDLTGSDLFFHIHMWEAELSREYRKQYGDPFTNSNDLSCGINFVLYEGYVYLTPYSGLGLQINWELVFASVDLVRKYGYWNNTDRDEDVSEEEWKRRGEEWNHVLDSNAWCRLPIIDVHNVYKIGPALTPRMEALALDVPLLIEQASYLKQANQYIDASIGKIDKDVCFQESNRLLKLAGEPINRWAFDWICNNVLREREKRGKQEEEAAQEAAGPDQTPTTGTPEASS